MLGLGFFGDKDFSAFILEVILENTDKEWENRAEKGRNQWGGHYQAFTTTGS